MWPFRKNKTETFDDPDDLWAALMNSFQCNELRRFDSLAKRNRSAVVQNFARWQKVPESVRSDQAKLNQYAQILIGIAHRLAELGVPEALEALMGTPDSPTRKWGSQLSDAQRLVDAGDAESAIPILRDVVAGLENTLGGSAVDDMLPKALGLLGVAHYRSGDVANAEIETKRALALCQTLSDTEGEKIYTENLRLMANPNAVIFRSKEGAVLTEDDLAKYSGTVDWSVLSGGAVSPYAQDLHQAGRQAGSSGNETLALKKFNAAADADPDWAYPIYDIAFTHLLAGRWEDALRGYERVDVMEPRGFFTAKTAIWSLTRELDGQFPLGTYLTYVGLEWQPDPQKKQEVVQTLIDRAPEFAPALKELALMASDPIEANKIIQSALQLDPDSETYGVLKVNLASQIFAQGNHEEALEILGELVLSETSTIGTKSLAGFTLTRLKRQIGNE